MKYIIDWVIFFIVVWIPSIYGIYLGIRTIRRDGIFRNKKNSIITEDAFFEKNLIKKEIEAKKVPVTVFYNLVQDSNTKKWKETAIKQTKIEYHFWNNSRYAVTYKIMIFENRSHVYRKVASQLYKCVQMFTIFTPAFLIFSILIAMITGGGMVFFSSYYEIAILEFIGKILIWSPVVGSVFFAIFFSIFACNEFIFAHIGKIYWKLSQQSMESLWFEKSFDAFSRDPVEARMIITPAFMDRLEEFSNKWNLKWKIRIIWEKDTFTLLLKWDIEKYGKESDGSYTLVKSMEEMLNLGYYSLPQTNTNNS